MAERTNAERGLVDAWTAALLGRLSFRRFVGLSFKDATPDETTSVQFRARLREANLVQRLFEYTIAQLHKQGLLVHEGTLVDATIVERSRGSKRGDGTSTRDADASFTKKHGRAYHGYKGHIACDLAGIVTGYRFMTAREHDSRRIDELTDQETHAVIADSAYGSAERRRRLRSRGVVDGISYKRQRGQAELPPLLKRINMMIAPARAPVEHPFAWMKQMGNRRARYRGRRRNELNFAVMLVAYNWKRSLSLMCG